MTLVGKRKAVALGVAVMVNMGVVVGVVVCVGVVVGVLLGGSVGVMRTNSASTVTRSRGEATSGILTGVSVMMRVGRGSLVDGAVTSDTKRTPPASRWGVQAIRITLMKMKTGTIKRRDGIRMRP